MTEEKQRDRVVLITGCGSPAGIGFATARRLVEGGDRVWATVRDLSQAEALRAGLPEPDRLQVRFLDVTLPDTIATVVQEIEDWDGGIDVLLNNAGYGLLGCVEQVDLDRARAQLETNFLGTLRVIQAVLPGMRARRRGHVVNVSTVFGAQSSLPGMGLYIASKAALDTASEALAVEVAPWDIRVTILQPGPVSTELSRETSNRFDAASDPYAGLVDRAYEWVRSGRGPAFETPEAVAEAIERILAEADPPLYAQTSDSGRAFVASEWSDPTGAHARSRFAPFLPMRRTDS
jgi:NAD(P)-dependent dehydrogenase (short-subunit alcohol dehydrogenase family)